MGFPPRASRPFLQNLPSLSLEHLLGVKKHDIITKPSGSEATTSQSPWVFYLISLCLSFLTCEMGMMMMTMMMTIIIIYLFPGGLVKKQWDNTCQSLTPDKCLKYMCYYQYVLPTLSTCINKPSEPLPIFPRASGLTCEPWPWWWLITKAPPPNPH